MASSKRYPRGKLKADDDGQAPIRIAVARNTIIIDFGKPMVWIGLDADTARTIAAKLTELADRIES